MILLFLLIVVLIVCGFVGSSMAKSKGKDPAVWFVLCFLTGILGIAVLAVFGPDHLTNNSSDDEDDGASFVEDDAPMSLKLATIAAAQADEEAKRKKAEVKSVKPMRPEFTFDERHWDELLDTDPDISDAADTVRAIGIKYEEELAARYLASLDKSQLSKIIDDIRRKAE